MFLVMIGGAAVGHLVVSSWADNNVLCNNRTEETQLDDGTYEQYWKVFYPCTRDGNDKTCVAIWRCEREATPGSSYSVPAQPAHYNKAGVTAVLTPG